MWDFIKKLFGISDSKPDRFLGILGDGNEEIDGVNVVAFEEAVGEQRAASFNLQLQETDPSTWRKFLHQFQDGSGACVAFTVATIAQILYFLENGRKIKFAPGWIFRQRRNRPSSGMYYSDAVDLASKGIILEDLFPAEDMNDAEIDAIKDVPYGDDVAEAFAISPDWVELPNDFDTIAKSLVKTEKGIMIWFQFGRGEFFNQAIPTSNGSSQQYRHSVTGIQAVRYKGTDYILVNDSADREGDTVLEGKEFGARKLISREWLAKHIILARYPLRFKYQPEVADNRPSYDGSVSSLQDCLEYEGVFPLGLPRGYFGSITRKAVQDFQIKYGIVYSGTPESTGFGHVGPKTSTKLRELYP